MKKAVLWIVGLVVGVPIAVVTFGAFMLFAFYPAKHAWNVYRMDAKNDRVWEDAIARVVTVEAKLGSEESVNTLETVIVCYKGYWARSWNLKAGAPASGIGPKSIGFEVIQADFPTGATLDINLRFLCNRVFQDDIKGLPLKFRYNEINIVAPELSLYCPFHYNQRSDEYAVQTDAGWVSHPYIVSVKKQPLRNLAARADMGTSETPSVSSGFAMRWRGITETGRGRSHWKSEMACWTDGFGRCNEALTRYCGKNPR